MNIEQKAINAMRYIGLKAIQKAKGGHVGMAISAAPIVFTLYTKFININPNDGKWIGRDRFVLSGGHGSMSLYPIFYFSNLFSLNDIENFKNEDSKTPGHPEFEHEKDNFIDASTGPLGQGFAMAVGMAIAQKSLYEQTKKYGDIFTNYTYVVCGDGDLQEGISYEAMAIAGKQQLSKLIVLHDSNKYQLDSSVEKVSSEDIQKRFLSNNWDYQKCSNDPKEIEKAILNAQKTNTPSFIEVETIIAEGLPIQDSNKGHHSCPSDEDINQFQNHFKINFKDWTIDQDVFDYFKENLINRSLKYLDNFNLKLNKALENVEFKNIYNTFLKENNNFDFEKQFKNVKIEKSNQATRVYLKSFLNSLENVPFTIATCADLVASTNLSIGKDEIIDGGHNLSVGIREFCMAAIMNGFSLYSNAFKIIGGTFLVFADYLKSALRIGALMKLPTIYAFTHDTYLVGGDGPTHQPYDQLPMLRAVENVDVYRPCDEEELRYALINAYQQKTNTSVFILSRQNINSINKIGPNDIKKGAYTILDNENPEYVLAASGSEVELALKVAKELGEDKTKVISVPCLNFALNLSSNEKEKLFRAKKALITIESSSDYTWFALHLENQKNLHIGAYTFGKSMDGQILYENKGFNPKSIIDKIKNL